MGASTSCPTPSCGSWWLVAAVALSLANRRGREYCKPTVKRFLALLLFLMLLLPGMTLVACEEEEEATPTPLATATAAPEATSTPTVSPTAATTAAPEATAPPGATPEATPTPAITATLEATLSPTSGRVQALVTRVIDGDTIEIEGGLKVRYIGIDTPETVHPSKPVECYGQEASARNKQLVEGKMVELEKDVSETDRYGRLLRYVYVDGQMVNELLVRGGYAQVSTYPPDVKYVDLLLAAQQEAQGANRGLWGACVAQPSSTEEAAPQGGGFTVPPCAATDCDCKDFTSHAHAQWFYENYDPGNRHRLDGDNDTIACESLP